MLSSLLNAELSRRDRVLILTTVVLTTALAWGYLFHLDRQMSAAMEYDKAMAAMGMTLSTPWTAVDALFAFCMWTIMMIAMMAPAAASVLMLFAASRLKRGGSIASGEVFLFAAGYATVWTTFSAGAAFVQWGLQRAAMLSAMASAEPHLAGAILISAGVYQLTPWKSQCLKHCRSPLGFLMTHWLDGKLGSFRMGFDHGIYCLGCCWALMAVLFVVGVMNLVWVAALTVFVVLEKAGPAGIIVARVAGAAMIVLGIIKILPILSY